MQRSPSRSQSADMDLTKRAEVLAMSSRGVLDAISKRPMQVALPPGRGNEGGTRTTTVFRSGTLGDPNFGKGIMGVKLAGLRA